MTKIIGELIGYVLATSILALLLTFVWGIALSSIGIAVSIKTIIIISYAIIFSIHVAKITFEL